jgi:hypothetical protein
LFLEGPCNWALDFLLFVIGIDDMSYIKKKSDNVLYDLPRF